MRIFYIDSFRWSTINGLNQLVLLLIKFEIISLEIA